MTRIPLDQKIRANIKEHLIRNLFFKVSQKNNKQLTEIIKKNTVASLYNHYSFSYKGVFYNGQIDTPRFKDQFLKPQFHDEMDEYLKNIHDIYLYEEAYIAGFINRMLNHSDSFDDYMLMLPDCLHEYMQPFFSEEWKPFHYPRTMSDEEIQQFIEKHDKWITLIKRRMLLDLLL